jgi:hypothetical protein
MEGLQAIRELAKAIEAGGYNVAPSNLTQGSALQIEDCSSVMELTTFEQKQLKLTGELKTTKVKSTTPQFNRQLDYGMLGASAQLEGNLGPDETSSYVRITVPMCYYSSTRRVTIASTLVDTVDGKKSDERAAEDSAMKIAADLEFDSFRGRDDFSNAGVFDGNPAALPSIMANMFGVFVQVRQSDGQREAHDLMFGEYGSDDSVVLYSGTTLNQDIIEDAKTRSAMNMGDADMLLVDPKVAASYNKLALGKERIMLAGAPVTASGSDLKKQHTANGQADLEVSRFLSGKTRPRAPRSINGAPAAPQSIACAVATGTTLTAFAVGDVYTYYATSENEIGESPATATQTATITTAGQYATVTITHPSSGVFRWFNVYRSPAGGTAASCKFVGRVKVTAGASSTVFTDLGNKVPGFVTGSLIEKKSLEMFELAPFSRLKLSQADLTTPEAFFQFTTLGCRSPRKNVLIDNLKA